MSLCLNIKLPDGNTFVADNAGLLSPSDILRLDNAARRLAQERNAALCVVTVPSLQAAYVGDPGGAMPGVDGLSCDIVAAMQGTPLFDLLHNGALIVVAVQNHRARITLGAAWNGAASKETDAIMRSSMFPFFKSGDYVSGIMTGATAVEQLVRGGPASVEATAAPGSSSYLPGSDTSSAKSGFPLLPVALAIIGVALQFGYYILRGTSAGSAAAPRSGAHSYSDSANVTRDYENRFYGSSFAPRRGAWGTASSWGGAAPSGGASSLHVSAPGQPITGQ